MHCAPRNKGLVAALLLPVLALVIPVAAASGSPRTSSTLSLEAARLEVARSEQRLAETTSARDAARTALDAMSADSADLVQQLADARASLRERAIEAYVASPPDETLLFLLGDDRVSDASAKFNLMAHSATTAEDAVDRYNDLKDDIAPELVRLATELQRLEQDVLDANDAVLQARANEAEAERQESERERVAAIARAQMAATTTTTTTLPAPVAVALEVTPASATPTPPSTTVPAPATPPLPVVPAGGPSEAQWAALRNCESTGNYRAVSKSGKYRGAYQFDYQTWASLGGSGDPAAASPAEQDARAKLLYSQRGWRPWPVCGRFLR